MKTAFVLTHIPDPRMNKRIGLLRSMGHVSVVCVRRSKEDIWEPKFSDIPHHIYAADFPSSRQTFRRLLSSLRYALFTLGKLRSEKPDLIYAGSLDTLMTACLYRLFHPGLRLVLEVPDIREAFLANGGGFRRRLVGWAERLLYPRVSLLVLTSDKFYDAYYHRYFPRGKTVVVENVPDFSAFAPFAAKQGGPFTVGFIGGMRYLEQMKLLADAAGMAGVQALFAGAGGTLEDQQAIQAYCQGKPNVTFTGKYRYDRDIAGLYGRVDCVYSVYDADNPNVRIALPNKLYEAAYCGLPLLAARGTYLGEVVAAHGLGYAVSHKDAGELAGLLRELSREGGVDKAAFMANGRKYLSQVPRMAALEEALQGLLPDGGAGDAR